MSMNYLIFDILALQLDREVSIEHGATWCFMQYGIDKERAQSRFWTHKRHPYLILTIELWCVYCECFKGSDKM